MPKKVRFRWEKDPAYEAAGRRGGWRKVGYVESSAATPEPAPTGAGTRITPLVMEDLAARDRLGTERYGTGLRAHNGRDALMDAYQEALDLCQYLRQAIYERDGK